MMDNYTTGLSTFLFRRSWGEVFRALSNEQAGQLIKAVYLYTEDVLQEPEDPELKGVFMMMIKQLNYSAHKHCLYKERKHQSMKQLEVPVSTDTAGADQEAFKVFSASDEELPVELYQVNG